MALATISLVLLAAILFLGLRIYLLLPRFFPRPPPPRQPDETCSLGIFLGSGMSFVLHKAALGTPSRGVICVGEDVPADLGIGGHTAEMRTLLSTLDFERYTPRTYIYCYGDTMSLSTISSLEPEKGSPSTASAVHLSSFTLSIIPSELMGSR